jgi:broad specificity phosphatase PhoE
VLCLGKEWEDVKIDHLYSSTMERAYQTALALAEANSGKPKVIPNSTLVERKNGEELISLFRSGGNTTYAMYGTFVAPRKTEDIDRDWAPPRGGESLNDVSRRAERFVREVVLRHGKELEASLESLKDGLGPVIAKSLPNGIPHVVIVAHNIFLVELFESLLSQGSVDHVTTDCHYENISWYATFFLIFAL